MAPRYPLCFAEAQKVAPQVASSWFVGKSLNVAKKQHRAGCQPASVAGKAC